MERSADINAGLEVYRLRQHRERQAGHALREWVAVKTDPTATPETVANARSAYELASAGARRRDRAR